MRILRFSGLVAVVLAWVVIYVSTYRNPWFDVFRHALSDLGGPRAADPWIYNVGLVATGVVTSTYSLYLAAASREKASIYASAFIFIAGVFLSLIGIFPSGTRPHTFVSTWFFVQMWMALVASAVDFLLRKKLIPGLTTLALLITGPLGAVLIDWPSVALLEIYGVVIIDIYVIILTLNY
ncbi:MAG: DUF998 domain-containing protein [Sulfolobales archaeon]|nr:DUF998 domain-containing protein [Sulfolobales archaeon]MDW8082504.1 DUF998 domain-containing protein [Sulfolobales archaeon]